MNTGTRLLLGSLLAGAAAGQDTWNATLRERMAAGQPLVTLAYRRDGHGLFEVGPAEGGSVPFRAFCPDTVIYAPIPIRRLGLAALALLGPGRGSLLAAADLETHLRRAGLPTEPAALRELLARPLPTTTDPVLARVELVDRVVALEWLRATRNPGAVAEFVALAKSKEAPPLLRLHAEDALAELGKRAPAARQRLDAATVALPANADLVLVVDAAVLPDAAAFAAAVRAVAVESSYRVVRDLRAPTPDDLWFGQYFADVLGTVPIELVRRFGDARVDHAVATLRTFGLGPGMKFEWTLDTAGRFESDVLATAMGELVAADPDGKSHCTMQDGALQVRSPVGELDATTTRLSACSKRSPGRMPDEATAAMLAAGPGVRLVLPATSKLLLGAVAALEVPGVGRTEVQMSFADGFRLDATIAMRDADAAAAIAAKLTAAAKGAIERARTALADRAPAAAIEELVALLSTVQCAATDDTVVVTTHAKVGAPALIAAGMLVHDLLQRL
jgi:hypothetical protein